MINTLLVDLDDTLLGNDMGTFLPAYFQQLARYFPADTDPQHLISEIIHGTRAMVTNTDPARVLFDVFAECFTRGTGLPRETWQPAFERYYAETYRSLQSVTTRRPEARAFMEWAFAQGYEVVIATSPLFTSAAIRERLRWAGVDDFPYALITSVENSHFAKPRPEYFAEILAHLGRRPEQALVIGNDWENDIEPAALLGIPTYWITLEGGPSDSPIPGDVQAQAAVEALVQPQPLGQGTLAECLAWAQSVLGPPEHGAQAVAVPATPSGPALPYMLSGIAATIASQLEAVPESAWQRRPAASEWSLTEVICHLRDVEREVNLPRLRTLVEVNNPFIAGADTDPWAVERNYQAQSGVEALRDFLAARRQATRYLASQPPEIWSRTARHAIFGPTELAEIVGWVLDHDRIHLEQIKATKARVMRGRSEGG